MMKYGGMARVTAGYAIGRGSSCSEQSIVFAKEGKMSINWDHYGTCPFCKQEKGQPCRDSRYKHEERFVGLPHETREKIPGIMDMGAYSVIGLFMKDNERKTCSLATGVGVEDAKEIARTDSSTFDFDEVRVMQTVNGKIFFAYTKGKQVPV
jgi:hypothetical protein